MLFFNLFNYSVLNELFQVSCNTITQDFETHFEMEIVRYFGTQ